MRHSELAVPILLLDKGQEPENSSLTIQHTKVFNICIPSHSINADKETKTVIVIIKINDNNK